MHAGSRRDGYCVALEGDVALSASKRLVVQLGDVVTAGIVRALLDDRQP